MTPDALRNIKVRLSSPEGRAFVFTVEDILPSSGDTFVLLRREDGAGELLVTRVVQDQDGTPCFCPAEDQDTIERVLSLYETKRLGLLQK